jgi:tRNA(adenine34) deaminase
VNEPLMNDDTYWMKRAFVEAEKAYELDEAPIGAVIVHKGRIIGRGGNRVETLHDPTAHAEILAIGAASDALGYPRLLDTTMYVTLEPCAMCAGAIVLARIPRLVFGARDPKMGAVGSVFDICRSPSLNHRVTVLSGVMEEEASSMLKSFFRKLRGKQDGP